MTVYPNSSDATHSILMATFSTIRQSSKLNGLLMRLKLIWIERYYPLSSSIDVIPKTETPSIITLIVSHILLLLLNIKMDKLLELTQKLLFKRGLNVIWWKDSWLDSKTELFFMSKRNLLKDITKSSIQDLSHGIKITSFLVTLT